MDKFTASTIMRCIKYTTFAITALVWVASSQSVADLPGCSLPCFQSAIAQTSCGDEDYTCQCQPNNYNTIKSAVTACLSTSACSISDLQKIQSFSNTFCPSVLASTSASQIVTTTPTSKLSSSSPATATIVATAPTTTQDAMGLPPTETPAAVAFGANTPGTSWGMIQQSSSTANRGPTFDAISIILLCVAAMIVALRFFARFYMKSMRNTIKSISWDDWLVIVALIGTTGVTADIILGTKYGMGKHLSTTTSVSELVSYVKIAYSFVIIITAVLGVLKLSILSLYVRMTPVSSHRLTCYILMGLVICHDIAAIFGAIFACSPVSEYWNLESYNIFENPACIKVLPFDIFNSAWSAMEDVIIWILPIPIVWGLNVSMRRKAGLYFLLGVSAVSVICAIIRLAVTIVWIRSSDISWNYPLIPFLSNIEACIAIITSSMPAIQLLFRKQAPLHSTEDAPAPPIIVEPTESTSQDSKTAVPSTVGETDKRSSRTWSFLSRLRPTISSTPHKNGTPMFKQPSIFKSQAEITTGPRTELKDLEEEGEVEFVPGLMGEKALRMK